MKSFRRCRFATIAAIALSLALPARVGSASDGALEINQACVAAGCFPGDAAGLPVEISASGSYRLTSDLVVGSTATSGIVIATDDTTLDLGGFAVRGPVTCSGTPVTSCTAAAGQPGILTGARNRIFGGTVRGFATTGVGTGPDSRVWDMVITSNGGDGIFLASGASLRNSHVVGNGGAGVSATSNGFAEVSGCTMRGNTTRGVNASSGLVLESRFQSNGLEGLRSFSGAADAGYALNIFSGNNGGGAQVTGGVSIGCNVVNGVSVCP